LARSVEFNPSLIVILPDEKAVGTLSTAFFKEYGAITLLLIESLYYPLILSLAAIYPKYHKTLTYMNTDW